MFRAGAEADLIAWLQSKGLMTMLKRMYFIDVARIHMIRILVIVDVMSYNLRWM